MVRAKPHVSASVKTKKKKMTRQEIKENCILYAIFLPVLIHIIVFCYVPMYGIVISFQDYAPGNSFFALDDTVKWVGFKHFANFVNSEFFWRLIRNTVTLSGLNLLFGFLAPVAFALLLNEIKAMRYKKFVQTASYLPHFISMVVVASMVMTLLADDGMFSQLARALGMDPIQYNTDPSVFPWVYVITNIWISFGWNSIIYMASISGIDPGLYEAARVDGATRWEQAWHVTLPAIKGTMFILLIFAIGGLLNANTEFILLMYNPAIYETSDVIGTYVYRIGILGGKFSQTTAIGLFMQVINFALLYMTNGIARKVEGYSLW